MSEQSSLLRLKLKKLETSTPSNSSEKFVGDTTSIETDMNPLFKEYRQYVSDIMSSIKTFSDWLTERKT
jgi:thiamine kinase-like enzyme